MLSTILLQSDSGSTISFSAVDNYEHCQKRNIVEFFWLILMLIVYCLSTSRDQSNTSPKNLLTSPYTFPKSGLASSYFFIAGETRIVGSASILRENRARESLNSRETTARRVPEETVRNESGSGQTYSTANTTTAATDARETKATEGWETGC